MNSVIDRPSSPTTPARQHPAGSPPRVLVLGAHIFPDALEWHIVDSFRQLGCPVEFYQTQVAGSGTPGFVGYAIRKGSSMFFREPERLIESSLVRKVQQFEPSLILATLGNQISPKTIQRLRAVSRAAIVCWCQDQMTTIGRQFLLGAEYDAVFVKDRYMQDLFSRMIRSSRFFYLPEACNPRVHRTVALSTEDRSIYGCDVMIAGTLYYYRQEILRQLTEFDLKIWGLRPDWLLSRLSSRLFGRPVFADDKARAVGGAKVCLNTLHYGEVDGLNCRAFEIAGCGGFQVITSVPVLAEHFEIGAEIVEFKTSGQLAELIRHFLDQPEIAAQIALRGQQRAHRDHTFEHRLREIMRIALGYQAIAP
jgi:spore maturation protein CgeB